MDIGIAMHTDGFAPTTPSFVNLTTSIQAALSPFGYSNHYYSGASWVLAMNLNIESCMTSKYAFSAFWSQYQYYRLTWRQTTNFMQFNVLDLSTVNQTQLSTNILTNSTASSFTYTTTHSISALTTTSAPLTCQVRQWTSSGTCQTFSNVTGVTCLYGIYSGVSISYDQQIPLDLANLTIAFTKQPLYLAPSCQSQFPAGYTICSHDQADTPNLFSIKNVDSQTCKNTTFNNNTSWFKQTIETGKLGTTNDWMTIAQGTSCNIVGVQLNGTMFFANGSSMAFSAATSSGSDVLFDLSNEAYYAFEATFIDSLNSSHQSTGHRLVISNQPLCNSTSYVASPYLQQLPIRGLTEINTYTVNLTRNCSDFQVIMAPMTLFGIKVDLNAMQNQFIIVDSNQLTSSYNITVKAAENQTEFLEQYILAFKNYLSKTDVFVSFQLQQYRSCKNIIEQGTKNKTETYKKVGDPGQILANMEAWLNMISGYICNIKEVRMKGIQFFDPSTSSPVLINMVLTSPFNPYVDTSVPSFYNLTFEFVDEVGVVFKSPDNLVVVNTQDLCNDSQLSFVATPLKPMLPITGQQNTFEVNLTKNFLSCFQFIRYQIIQTSGANELWLNGSAYQNEYVILGTSTTDPVTLQLFVLYGQINQEFNTTVSLNFTTFMSNTTQTLSFNLIQYQSCKNTTFYNLTDWFKLQGDSPTLGNLSNWMQVYSGICNIYQTNVSGFAFFDDGTQILIQETTYANGQIVPQVITDQIIFYSLNMTFIDEVGQVFKSYNHRVVVRDIQICTGPFVDSSYQVTPKFSIQLISGLQNQFDFQISKSQNCFEFFYDLKIFEKNNQSLMVTLVSSYNGYAVNSSYDSSFPAPLQVLSTYENQEFNQTIVFTLSSFMRYNMKLEIEVNVSQACDSMLMSNPMFNSTQKFAQDSFQNMVANLDAFMFSPVCPIYGLAVTQVNSQDSTLDYSQTINESSVVCDIFVKNCSLQVNPSKMGTLQIEVVPVIRFGNPPFQPIPLTLVFDCPVPFSPLYNLTYNNKSKTVFEWSRYTPDDGFISINQFNVSNKGCQNVTYTLIKSLNNTESPENITIQCVTSGCKMKVDNIVFEDIHDRKFFIVAKDIENGLQATSDEFVISVIQLPNKFAPKMERPPTDVIMFSNETQVLNISQNFTDQDLGDIPILSEVKFNSSVASQFITFDNQTFQLKINPNSQEQYVGQFKVSFLIDDQRGKVNEQVLMITVKSSFATLGDTKPKIKPKPEPPKTSNVSLDFNSTKPAQTLPKPVVKPQKKNGTQSIYVIWSIESIDVQGIVTVKFNNLFDTGKMRDVNLTQKDLTFILYPNHELEDIQIANAKYSPRDLNITKVTHLKTDVNSMEFKLEFAKPNDVSKGGVDFKDRLLLKLDRHPEKFKFQNQVKNNQDVTPELFKNYDKAFQDVPMQVDLSLKLNVAIKDTGENIESSMNNIMFGTFVINIFISIGMKQLLKAIKVIQYVAYLKLLNISFRPIALLFLGAIYNFATFKVIPKQFMDIVLIKLGLKEAPSPSQDKSKRILQEAQAEEEERPLVEVEKPNFFENLNMLFVAFGVFLVCVLCAACLLKVLQNRPELKKKLKDKMYVIIFSTVHQSVNNAAIPLIYNSMVQIKGNIHFKMSVYEYVAPCLIISAMIIYPFAAQFYLKKNIHSLKSKVFFDAHYSALQNTKLNGIWFIYLIHFRKVVFCYIMVFMVHIPAIQIICIVLLSEFMMIQNIQVAPYSSFSLAKEEAINESIIIIVCYHLILQSDFVLNQYTSFKDAVAYSLISFIVFVVVFFVMMIVMPLFKITFKACKTIVNTRRFNARMKKNIEAAAMQMLIQIDQVKQLKIMLLKKKIETKKLIDTAQPHEQDLKQMQKIKRALHKVQQAIEVNEQMLDKMEVLKHKNRLWKKKNAQELEELPDIEKLKPQKRNYRKEERNGDTIIEDNMKREKRLLKIISRVADVQALRDNVVGRSDIQNQDFHINVLQIYVEDPRLKHQNGEIKYQNEDAKQHDSKNSHSSLSDSLDQDRKPMDLFSRDRSHYERKLVVSAAPIHIDDLSSVSEDNPIFNHVSDDEISVIDIEEPAVEVQKVEVEKPAETHEDMVEKLLGLKKIAKEEEEKKEEVKIPKKPNKFLFVAKYILFGEKSVGIVETKKKAEAPIPKKELKVEVKASKTEPHKENTVKRTAQNTPKMAVVTNSINPVTIPKSTVSTPKQPEIQQTPPQTAKTIKPASTPPGPPLKPASQLHPQHKDFTFAREEPIILQDPPEQPIDIKKVLKKTSVVEEHQPSKVVVPIHYNTKIDDSEDEEYVKDPYYKKPVKPWIKRVEKQKKNKYPSILEEKQPDPEEPVPANEYERKLRELFLEVMKNSKEKRQKDEEKRLRRKAKEEQSDLKIINQRSKDNKYAHKEMMKVQNNNI